MVKTVALSGTGVTTSTVPTYTLTPTNLAFGSVKVGTTTPGQVVTLKNTGSVVLAITSISRGGTNPGQFTHSSGRPTQLAVGAQCTAAVYFKPTSTGSKSATLKVTPGGGAAVKTVALTGTGT